MERFALFMDRFIDVHPVIAGCTYPFTAACMVVFVWYTG
jgi:hypothetical protein